MRASYCGPDGGTPRTMRRMGRDDGVRCGIAIASSYSPFPRGTETAAG